MDREATIDSTGQYRYDLTRYLGAGSGLTCCFIMLNPSTADAYEDDPTIRRCIHFTQAFGCDTLRVVNLFAYRTPSPKVLEKAKKQGIDIIGPENDEVVYESVKNSYITFCAWGSNKLAVDRADYLLPRLTHNSGQLLCLGLTKSGHPKHPLYLKNTTPSSVYRSLS